MLFLKKSHRTHGRAKRSFVIFFLAALPLFAILVTSSHFHKDLATRLDCALCKSALDLSSGNMHSTPSLEPLDYEKLPYRAEPVQFEQKNMVTLTEYRAPPC
jgi:hypothetical protein